MQSDWFQVVFSTNAAAATTAAASTRRNHFQITPLQTNTHTRTNRQDSTCRLFFLEEEEEEGGDTKERQAQEQVRKRRAALLYKIRERELHGETLLDKCQCLLRSRRRVLIKQTADFHHNEIPRAAAAAATHITHG